LFSGVSVDIAAKRTFSLPTGNKYLAVQPVSLITILTELTG